jgi:transposase
VDTSEANAAIVITGSTEFVPTGRDSAGRQSQCEPWRAIIIQDLERGLTARRIWQDLRTDHGFEGDYQSVQRFVRRLNHCSPLPFRRMECGPGEEAQVDFGKGAPVLGPDGKRTRPHLFRIVLSCSRKAYSEVVPRQTTEQFIRCIENAFCHFGGVTKTLVIDNLKAAVTQADWYDPELNPKIQEFCRHYGTVVLPTRPYTPRHKGKVERGVGYAQSNALKGRTFQSLAEQNRFLAEWESTVADTRIHGTTRKQVGKVFAEVEKPALMPLPPGRFPCFQEAQRSVNRDGHVEVAKAYYSAPPEFVGRTLWARWDGHVVRLFDHQLRQIAIHAQHEPGRFATDARHIVAEKRGGIERGTAWWLNKAGAIGPHAGSWAEGILRERGIHGIRVVIGLVSLTHRHPVRSIEQACQTAQSHGCKRLRDIRNLIKRSESAAQQEQFEFAAEHPLIRSLSDYSKLVHVAFEKAPL